MTVGGAGWMNRAYRLKPGAGGKELNRRPRGQSLQKQRGGGIEPATSRNRASKQRGRGNRTCDLQEQSPPGEGKGESNLRPPGRSLGQSPQGQGSPGPSHRKRGRGESKLPGKGSSLTQGRGTMIAPSLPMHCHVAVWLLTAPCAHQQ